MYSSYINTASDFIHIMIIMAVLNRWQPGGSLPQMSTSTCYSHWKQHCGENNERSNPCLISTRGERRNSKSLECVDTWFPEVVWDQGWEVSPLYGKNQGNYPVSDNTAEILSTMAEMAEWGETKFGESCNENT